MNMNARAHSQHLRNDIQNETRERYLNLNGDLVKKY